MSSRPLRWFGGLVGGLVLLSVVSLIPGIGLNPAETTQAQYAAPAAVGGMAGGGQAASQCTLRIWGRCVIP